MEALHPSRESMELAEPPKPSPFLALPGEIRNSIYDYAADWNDVGRTIERIHRQVQQKLNHRTPKGPAIYDKEVWDAVVAQASPKRTPTIFLLNRRTYAEARARLEKKPLLLPALLPRCVVLLWRSNRRGNGQDYQNTKWCLENLISTATLQSVPDLTVTVQPFIDFLIPSGYLPWPERSWHWPLAPFSNINEDNLLAWETRHLTVVFPRAYPVNYLQSTIREIERTLLPSARLTICLSLPDTTGWSILPRSSIPINSRSHSHLGLPSSAQKRALAMPPPVPRPYVSPLRIALTTAAFYLLPLVLVAALTAILPPSIRSSLSPSLQTWSLAFTARISFRLFLYDLMTTFDILLSPHPHPHAPLWSWSALTRAQLSPLYYPLLYASQLVRPFRVSPVSKMALGVVFLYGGTWHTPGDWQQGVAFVSGGWTFWACTLASFGWRYWQESVLDLGAFFPGRRLWIGI
ncbi:hypothetical protein EJ05DRAFT_133870 [Pseudovirgaria hyperparasitica]|uniref:Uncharacterized protein n=1 Tax=Pseudovirgaria hyperparasitica TaxID=470096 RepID=A0A6A6VX54_9PEZI|nr:uncharacterized protein EJ05DRAFT_133870 [Pseudovirgaria hyperparasitica]KAF2754803.1 hypothetical protein EJ05DRAFT_133870 [Pseudovirgaria hyperparasitica]